MRRVLGKWCGARPGGGGVTSSTVVGGTHGSRPTGHFCRAGPACPAVGAVQVRAGRCGHRPLRKRNKRCNGRATARVAPTKALQGVRRGERNPPVTASPCQPPLGKRAEGTGEADCHSQCAHWPRNDTVNKRCGANTEGGQRRPPLRSVTRGAAKRGVEDAAPYGCIIDGAVGRADVGIGPYEDVTSSAVGYWATARVAPGNDRFLRWFL